MSTKENSIVHESCNDNHSLQGTVVLLNILSKKYGFGYELSLMSNVAALNKLFVKKKNRLMSQQIGFIC